MGGGGGGVYVSFQKNSIIQFPVLDDVNTIVFSFIVRDMNHIKSSMNRKEKHVARGGEGGGQRDRRKGGGRGL